MRVGRASARCVQWFKKWLCKFCTKYLFRQNVIFSKSTNSKRFFRFLHQNYHFPRFSFLICSIFFNIWWASSMDLQYFCPPGFVGTLLWWPPTPFSKSWGWLKVLFNCKLNNFAKNERREKIVNENWVLKQLSISAQTNQEFMTNFTNFLANFKGSRILTILLILVFFLRGLIAHHLRTEIL